MQELTDNPAVAAAMRGLFSVTHFKIARTEAEGYGEWSRGAGIDNKTAKLAVQP